MSFRAVVFDLDGTLLNSDKKINPENCDAIRNLQKQGIEVLLATGRHPQATHFIYSELGLNGLVICCNGACIYDYHAMQPVFSNPLGNREIEGVYKLCRKHGIAVKLYTDQTIVYEESDAYIDYLMAYREKFPHEAQINLEKVNDYPSFFMKSPIIWKYVLRADDHSSMKALAQDAADQYAVSCEWWSEDGLDITCADNTKGNTLARWAEMKQISLQDIMAFGDNCNDISMLSRAGMGVAMGQASAEVQSHADIVAPGNNDSDAIARILQKYF